MKYLLIPIFLLSLFTLFPKEYTIEEIYKIIDSNNYSIKKLEKTSLSLKNQSEIEGSDFMDTGIGYKLGDLTFKDNNFDPEMIKHTIYIKQKIPLSGKLYFRKKASFYEYINSLEEIKLKKLELKKMVLSNIVDFTIIKNIIKNKEKELDYMKQLFEIVKTQFSTGQVSISNAIQIEIKVAQTEIMLTGSEKMEKLLENEIIDILDTEDESFNISNLSLSLEKLDISKTNENILLTKALDFNPSLKMKDNEIQLMKNLSNNSISELVPDLEIMFEYMVKPDPIPEHSLGLQFELNLPLLSAYSKTNKVIMNKKEEEKAVFEKRENENDLKNYLKKKYIELTSDLKQSYLLSEKIVKPSEDNIKTLIVSYQVNKIGIDSLIEAILVVYDLQNQYQENIGNIYKILFEIESITGEKYYNF
jgi:outer membrane protein TolC